MKNLIIIISVLTVFLFSCRLDPPYSAYTNIPLGIDTVHVPDEGLINTPLEIYVKCSAPNGCFNNLHFKFEKIDNFHYQLYALCSYESHGVCPEVIIEKDSTIVFTPAPEGEYVIFTWVTPYKSVSDTIEVAVTPGR